MHVAGELGPGIMSPGGKSRELDGMAKYRPDKQRRDHVGH